MLVVYVENLGSRDAPSLRAMANNFKSSKNSKFRRRVVHHNGSKELLESLAALDDTNSCLDDLVQAAFLLGMTTERASPGTYVIPEDE